MGRSKLHQVYILFLTDPAGIGLLTWKGETKLVALSPSMLSVSGTTSSYPQVIVGNSGLFAHPKCECNVAVGVMNGRHP